MEGLLSFSLQAKVLGTQSHVSVKREMGSSVLATQGMSFVSGSWPGLLFYTLTVIVFFLLASLARSSLQMGLLHGQRSISR